MPFKTKHTKQSQKLRQHRTAAKKSSEPDIDFDTSAYVVYNRLQITYPCLSFDVVGDDLSHDAARVDKFPLSLTLIAGAQTPPHVENNYIYVVKVDDIKALKQEKDDDEDDSADDEDGADDENHMPKLLSLRVTHKGCVNRVRANKIGGRILTASWSDRGKVHIYDLTTTVQAVQNQRSINTYVANKIEPKPTFTFGGHLSEGYGLDWSPFKTGSLATGDCKKNIHVWNMRNQSDWLIDQQPLVGHSNSVEDIKWSPEEPEMLATCSVDRSVRFWDLRQTALSRCVHQINDSHRSDVNVIDWNKFNKNLLVSGGDDGVVKVWDIRRFKSNTGNCPVAEFDYHKKPITSVEWDPYDETVLAVASDDDRLTIWDLAVEKDDEAEEAEMETDEDEEDDEEDDEDVEDGDKEKEGSEDGVDYDPVGKVPEQMLFLHQGQNEIKELHWHSGYKGLIISTALNGMNIFKTISA